MAVKKRGKPRRSDSVPPPIPESAETVGIFDDVPTFCAEEPSQAPATLFEDAPALATAPPAEIIAVERDLTPDQRAEFEKLLNQKMTIEERAEQLVTLAKFIDTKRAPVGLRAIMEINRITRLTEERPTEAPAMFQLPPDTRVNVTVEKVVK